MKNNETKLHYKMYKAGKIWLFSAIAVSFIGIAGVQTNVHADSPQNDGVQKVDASQNSGTSDTCNSSVNTETTKPQTPESSKIKDEQGQTGANGTNSNSTTTSTNSNNVNLNVDSSQTEVGTSNSKIDNSFKDTVSPDISVVNQGGNNNTYSDGGLMPIQVSFNSNNYNVNVKTGDTIQVNIPDSSQIDWDKTFINGGYTPYGSAVINKNNSSVIFTFSNDVADAKYGVTFAINVYFKNIENTDLQGPFTLTGSSNLNGVQNKLQIANHNFNTQKAKPSETQSGRVQAPGVGYTTPGNTTATFPNENNGIGPITVNGQYGQLYKYNNGFITVDDILDPDGVTQHDTNRQYHLGVVGTGANGIDLDSFMFYTPTGSTPLNYMQLYEQTGISVIKNSDGSITINVPDGVNDGWIRCNFNLNGIDPTATGSGPGGWNRLIYYAKYTAKVAEGNSENASDWGLNIFYQPAESSPRIAVDKKVIDVNSTSIFTDKSSEDTWLLNGVTSDPKEVTIKVADSSAFDIAWNNKQVGIYQVKYESVSSDGKILGSVIGFVTISAESHVYTTYVNSATGQIITKKTSTGQYGDGYNDQPIEIDGYELDKTKLPSNAQGNYGINPVYVTYYYNPAEKANIQYIDNDANGQLISDISADAQNISGYYNGSVDLTNVKNEIAILIKKGYQLVDDSSLPSIFDFDGNKTFKIYFKHAANDTQIETQPFVNTDVGNDWQPVDSILKLVDENGNDVDAAQAIASGILQVKYYYFTGLSFARINGNGSTTSATLDDIHNKVGTYVCFYIYNGKFAKTQIFVGTKNSPKVAESIVYEDNGQMIGEPVIINGNPGDTYDVYRSVPNGYHLVNPQNNIVTLSDSSKTIIIPIEKNENPSNPVKPNDSHNPSNNGNPTDDKTVNKGDNSRISETNGQTGSSSQVKTGNTANNASIKSNNNDRINPKNDKNKANALPNTGQSKQNSLLALIGSLLLGSVSLFGLVKFRKNH